MEAAATPAPKRKTARHAKPSRRSKTLVAQL
jgi:hypothetical protein